jgi:hypothetical protein
MGNAINAIKEKQKKNAFFKAVDIKIYCLFKIQGTFLCIRTGRTDKK